MPRLLQPGKIISSLRRLRHRILILLSYLKHPWLPVTLIEGPSPGLGENAPHLRVVFAGHLFLLHEIQETFFPKTSKVTHIGQVPWFLGPTYALRRLRAIPHDISVLERLPWWPASVAGTSAFHSSMEAVIQTPKSIEEYLAALTVSTRKRVTRANKYKFTFRYSNTVDDMRTFYHDYFVPMAKIRHGEMAHIFPFSTLLALKKNMEILYVEEDGKTLFVAAHLVSKHTKSIRMWRGGTTAEVIADPDLMSALNTKIVLHCLEKAIQEGYESVSMGLTVPAPFDGIFFFKRKMLSQFVPAEGSRPCLLALQSPAALQALSERPLLIENNEKMECLFGMPAPLEDPQKRFLENSGRLCFDGMEKITILTNSDAVREAVTALPPEKLPCPITVNLMMRESERESATAQPPLNSENAPIELT